MYKLFKLNFVTFFCLQMSVCLHCMNADMFIIFISDGSYFIKSKSTQIDSWAGLSWDRKFNKLRGESGQTTLDAQFKKRPSVKILILPYKKFVEKWKNTTLHSLIFTAWYSLLKLAADAALKTGGVCRGGGRIFFGKKPW